VEFSGANVRIARVFQGLTQEQLAEAVSTSPASLWNVERGRVPSDSLLAALGLVLGFEPEFFFDPINTEFTVDCCHFRSSVSATEKTRKKILARGSLFAHLIAYLQTVLKFPTYQVPDLRANSPEDIERAAEKCRSDWGLGTSAPISKMSRVLENHGVMVRQLQGQSIKLDAFSTRPNQSGLGFVVLSDGKGSASRARFDMAHELGHLVMHPDTSGLLADREKQADRFASAFLLPRDGFAREFWAGGKVDWNNVFHLKSRWKVSIQAMIYRAYDLDLINAVEFRKAYKTISVKGWRKAEPNEPASEPPELFNKAMRTLVERKHLQLSDMARQLHWTPQTFIDVTGWEEGEATLPQRQAGLSLMPNSQHAKQA
jgi:Zn-dependent peptidase ImmA (M78 family)/transcriptional regulator with XRE-family HTH domain